MHVWPRPIVPADAGGSAAAAHVDGQAAQSERCSLGQQRADRQGHLSRAVERAGIAQLRGDLRTACLEPFADLAPAKKQALLRRLERIRQKATVDWGERPALDLMLMLWCFLKDLTDREVLILWEGSAMDRAMRKLEPMCQHGFGERASGSAACDWARSLLYRLRDEGLYR